LAAGAILALVAIGPVAALAQGPEPDQPASVIEQPAPPPAPTPAPPPAPPPAPGPAPGPALQPAAGPASTVDLNPRPLGRPGPQKAAAAATGAETPGPAPALSQSTIVRTSLSLGVVLALIGVCALGIRVLKRRGVLVGGSIAAGARAPSGLLETLGRYPLGRGQTLLLIKLDQRVLLIGQTTGTLRAGGGSLSTLCELSSPEDVASILLKAQDAADASSAARFQTMLREFDDRHGPREPDFETPASVNLRTARSTPAGDRAELWNDRADILNIPIIPVYTDRRPPAHAAHAAHAAPVPQPATASESFGSLRDRLSALRGEAHR